jgi:sn-glycerol 3-phosphate transport system ATP-binding protein
MAPLINNYAWRHGRRRLNGRRGGSLFSAKRGILPLQKGRQSGGGCLSAVVLESVVKRWGPAVAVDRVTFTAQPGTLVVLLGPSGCGKSTTLRLIAGLESASEGRIVIGGRDVTRLPPPERGVSMVFQSYALFPHLSVAENIMFGLKVRQVEKTERARRLAGAAELLGLTPLLDRRPSQLSGGQQQRVALGRAIVADTAVCLMDEPLSNLDAQLRQEMRREIRALQQKLRVTMLYVTHDQTEAMTMADQVVVMRDGHIEQDGPPAELYNRPATAFVARFVGTPPMNLMENAPGFEGRLLGVRPEDIHLAPGGMDAEVESVEYLGADTILACRAAGQRVLVRQGGQTALKPGEKVGLNWAPGARHVFDKASGRRLDGAGTRH